MTTKKTATKKPAAKKPAAKKPAAKKTATKKTATKKTAAKKTATKKTAAKKEPTSSSTGVDAALAEQLEQRFAEIGGWRGALLSRMRALIIEADPDIVEERKWVKPTNPHGVPTYSHGGLILTLEVYKDYVKLTFAQGSKVADPTGIFNASLLGLRRAIDIREDAVVDATAFKGLVRAAVDVALAKKR